MTSRPTGTNVLHCDEKHLKDIRDIFNEVIRHTTAL